MRVLLDTNILARAAGGPPGLAHRLFLDVTRHEHTLLLSTFLIVELGRVLRYDRVRRLHGLSDEDIDLFLSDVTLITEMVESSEAVPAIVVGDPEDDPVVHTAVLGRADYLCTHDRHLLQPDVIAYCQLRGIQVGKDLDLLRVLQS
jgi:putative PIN family toxin of toxin-antitoxin system